MLCEHALLSRGECQKISISSDYISPKIVIPIRNILIIVFIIASEMSQLIFPHS